PAAPELPPAPPAVVTAPTVSAAPPTPPAGTIFREAGIASWYGRELDGRTTLTGEIFDRNGLTAAHRTLPLGTVLRVTNLENNRTVTVTVNDRGPFVHGRILELSRGAAGELGFIAQGTAKVAIETTAPVPPGGTFTVVAAVFAEEEQARLLKERLTQRYEVVAVVPVETNAGRFFRVRVGNYPSEEKAERIAAKLSFEGVEPLVLRKD
nr:septal ring lytic transglycosylase RlpA family protein [Nitrospiraceae bacterium]